MKGNSGRMGSNILKTFYLKMFERMYHLAQMLLANDSIFPMKVRVTCRTPMRREVKRR